MIELIGNCQHHNPVQTAFLTDTHHQPVGVLKTSFSSDGVKALEREHQGLGWYVTQLHADPANAGVLSRLTNSYARLEFPYHPGEVGHSHRSISKNYGKLHSAIDHWQNLFSGQPFSHGDYTISNIVFRGDSVTWVLDWEGFTAELPRGFDLMNLIMEACLLRYSWHGKNRLTKSDVQLLTHLMNLISGIVILPEGFMERPASVFSEACRSLKTVFGMQWKKYPFVLLEKKFIDDIDRHFALNKRIT